MNNTTLKEEEKEKIMNFLDEAFEYNTELSLDIVVNNIKYNISINSPNSNGLYNITIIDIDKEIDLVSYIVFDMQNVISDEGKNNLYKNIESIIFSTLKDK